VRSAIARREILAAPLALVGCAAASPYFGRTTPPASQRLVYSNGEEPSSLDPAQSVGSKSEVIMTALLDSLTAFDPLTLEPAAALATHYHVDSGGTQYTFYLRGHPKPRGIRLPNIDSLPGEFSRGRKAPPDRTPALWSDGTPITARDFVYSWRRFVDPATAASMASYLAHVGNAEEIVRGTKPPTSLAVRAVDDLAFEFELVAPLSSFLRLLWQPFLAAVPRQAIEAAKRRGHESSWTTPGNYVSSGPFQLQEWRSYDRIVLSRNPRYWEAQSVDIEEIVFLPVTNLTTNVNLYRVGVTHAMDPRLIPPPLVPALSRKRDFGSAPALSTLWYLLNTNTPPFDRPAVRYALNLATDKAAIVNFLGAGQKPANGIVPPMRGYSSSVNLPVSINGRSLNVLAFDPRLARDLLRAEGIGGLELSMTFPPLPRSKDIASILQRQWHEHLGLRLTLSEQGETIWFQDMLEKRYRLTEDSWTARCDDPNDYLALFTARTNYSTWVDPKFDRGFTTANAILEPAKRMNALAACEAQLMQAMPVIPIFHDTWAYLEAPYLRGLKSNPFGFPRFKYAWIDTAWKPS